MNVNVWFCGLVDSSSTGMEDSFYLSLVWQVRLDSKNCKNKSKVLFMLKQIQDIERGREGLMDRTQALLVLATEV